MSHSENGLCQVKEDEFKGMTSMEARKACDVVTNST